MVKAISDRQSNASRSGVETAPADLRLNEAGFALLRERLRAANRDNPDFEAQAGDLLGLVRRALEELRRGFGDRIVRVLADGEWAHQGIDLHTAPDSKEIGLRLVTRLDRRDLSFGSAAARVTSPYLRAGRYSSQLDVAPQPLWQRTLALLQAHDRPVDVLGIPLLTEA